MDLNKRQVMILLLLMFFHQGDATGGPILHSNGLCIYPKYLNGRQTLLVWSTNCSGKKANFIVSHDYSIYHIDSGKCVWPKNGKLTDPGDTGKLVLESNICSTKLKFRPTRNGYLHYYPTHYLGVCLGEGRDSLEPVEGDPVMLSKPACSRETNCQHLTYVYEKKSRSNVYLTIDCRENFLVDVLSTYYGDVDQEIPLKLRVPKCNIDTTTSLVRMKCNGKRGESYVMADALLRTNCSTFSNYYLVVRYSCIRTTKPAAPTKVTIRVIGMKKLNVTWFPHQETNIEHPIDWYSVCWKTLTSDRKCNNGNITSSSTELNHLEPATLYFITVASHNCNGGIGYYSASTVGITHAVPIKQSAKPASAENFEIIFGELKVDDRYIQIVVKKQANPKQLKMYPESYSKLEPYDKESQGNVPYIAAELDREYVKTKKVFTVGDGKHYSKNTNRKKREVGFLNAKLEPDAYYSVFQRTFKHDNLYYNSEWMEVVHTANSPNTNENPGKKDNNSNPRNRDNKDTAQDETSDRNQGNKGVIIGTAAAGAVAIILIAAVFVIVFIRRKGRSRNNSDGDEKSVFFNHSSAHGHVGIRQSAPGIHDQPEQPEVVVNVAQKPPDDAVYAKPDKTKKKKAQNNKSHTYANLTDANVNFKENPSGSGKESIDMMYAKPDKIAKKKVQEDKNEAYSELTDVNFVEDPNESANDPIDAMYAKPDKSAKKKVQKDKNEAYSNLTDANVVENPNESGNDPIDAMYAKPDKSAKKKVQKDKNEAYSNLTDANVVENPNESVNKPIDVTYAKPDKTAKKKVQENKNEAYSNLTEARLEEDPNGISILIFPNYVQDMKESNNDGFEEEFKKLAVGPAFPRDISKKPVNAEKEKYANIVTYDHSRVVLSGDESQDYINASFIDGIKPDVYIASEGPTGKTVDDFWRMIWEQDSQSIIALTNVTELGKIKCVQYWPEKESTFGKIHVQMITTELFADYVIRTLSMQKDGATKKVKQYHFTSWPDHGVPQISTQLLAFRQRFKNLHKKGPRPIIVHCSAGVGRTAAFIGLDIVLERLDRLHYKTINIHDTIKELRTRRVNMVQTLEQYVFIHDAVVESLLCGVTEIDAGNLRNEIERLEQRDQEKSLTGFELEFQKLDSVCPALAAEECEMALRKVNQAKNRHPNIYPAENFRVVISGNGGEYINATYVHGYTQNNAYIATQTPLLDTINDFWKMVYEKKAPVVVMLNSLVEGEMVYPQYWPQNIDVEEQYDELLVKMVSSDARGPIISRTFIIKKQNSPAEHTVRHVQFTDWPEDGVPLDSSDVMFLLETVVKDQQCSSNGEIIVHCSNGAHRTGTYLTLATQRERIMTEHVIDVFKRVKIMRGQRPQFIGNVNQYKFCHYTILNFVESFEYDNIPKSARD